MFTSVEIDWEVEDALVDVVSGVEVLPEAVVKFLKCSPSLVFILTVPMKHLCIWPVSYNANSFIFVPCTATWKKTGGKIFIKFLKVN